MRECPPLGYKYFELSHLILGGDVGNESRLYYLQASAKQAMEGKYYFGRLSRRRSQGGGCVILTFAIAGL